MYSGDRVDFGLNFPTAEIAMKLKSILGAILQGKSPQSPQTPSLIDNNDNKNRRWTAGSSSVPVPTTSTSTSTTTTSPLNTSPLNINNTPLPLSTSPLNISTSPITKNINTTTSPKESPTNSPSVNRKSVLVNNNSNNNGNRSKEGTPVLGRSRSNTPNNNNSNNNNNNNKYGEMMLQMHAKSEELYKIEMKMNKTSYVPGEEIEGELLLNLSFPQKSKCVAILFQGIEKSFNGIDFTGKKTYDSHQFWGT